jgi:hypothetical protein
VLANSTVVDVSEAENPDLWWAMRGAGSSMGIVSEFRFKTFVAPEKVTHFLAVMPWNANTSIAGLKTIQDWAADTMPMEMNARVFITPQFANLEGLYFGGKADMAKELDPLLKKVGGVMQQSAETDWLGQLDHFGGGLNLNQTHPYNKACQRTNPPASRIPG